MYGGQSTKLELYCVSKKRPGFDMHVQVCPPPLTFQERETNYNVTSRIVML